MPALPQLLNLRTLRPPRRTLWAMHSWATGRASSTRQGNMLSTNCRIGRNLSWGGLTRSQNGAEPQLEHSIPLVPRLLPLPGRIGPAGASGPDSIQHPLRPGADHRCGRSIAEHLARWLFAGGAVYAQPRSRRDDKGLVPSSPPLNRRASEPLIQCAHERAVCCRCQGKVLIDRQPSTT